MLEDLGDLKGAENSYREAIRLKPDLAEPHRNLGDLLINRGHSGEAGAEYKEALVHEAQFRENTLIGIPARSLAPAIASARVCFWLRPFADLSSAMSLDVTRRGGLGKRAEDDHRERLIRWPIEVSAE